MAKIIALIIALAAVALARAHSVWIEPNKEGGLIIRFAEPDGKFEKSPGHLDELDIPVAWSNGEKGPTKLEVQKKSDHFLIVGAKATDSVQIEARFEVLTATNRPGRLPNFYARWQPEAKPRQPKLMLDIVPTGEKGVARVFFRGKPLGGLKATFRLPDESEKLLEADAEGFIRFTSTQSGQHMLSIAHHRESLPGFIGGKAYDLLSHNAALTWKTP